MPFLLAFAIVAISVLLITYRTYVCYGQYGIKVKIAFLLFLLLCIFAPIICYILHHNFATHFLAKCTNGLYFLFGFAFILFTITLIRDVIWTIIDVIRQQPIDDLKNAARLKKVNIFTFIFALLIAVYGYYEANKMPNIVSYDITSDKIKQATKLVMLSDLHINIDTNSKVIQKLVDKVNSLEPDAIVLVGDIVDNTPALLEEQINELKNLKAKQGIYFSLGNHEFYNGALDWGIRLGQLNFNFLNNYGMNIGESGIYVGGIPDINSAMMIKMPIKIANTLFFKKENSYVILLSHSPKVAEDISAGDVDLQLSAHTHGGQIFPFHFLVKHANDNRLAGFYEHNGMKIYVSRGTRYWGPPLRLFAPSEITVFNFKPEKK